MKKVLNMLLAGALIAGIGFSVVQAAQRIVLVNGDGTEIGTAANPIQTSGGVAGSDTQVQFNDAGVMGADAGMTYNKTTDFVTLNSPSIGTFPTHYVTIGYSETSGEGGTITSGAGLLLDSESGITQLRGDSDSVRLNIDNASNLTVMDIEIDMTFDQTLFAVDDDGGNQFDIVNNSCIGQDFGVATQTDPALYIFSDTCPSSATDQWGAIKHDKTDLNISAGKGNINITPFAGSSVVIGGSAALSVPGGITTGAAADPSVIFDVLTATDTDFWMGVQEDAGGDDDDFFEIGDGTTPGTNAFFYMNTTGAIGLRTSDIDHTLEVGATTGNASIGISDPDVAHGFTTISDADLFFEIEALSSTAGGTLLSSFSDTDAVAYRLRAYIGSTNPTDTTPAIELFCGKLSGTSNGNLAAAETCLTLSDSGGATDFLTVLGSGAFGFGNTTPASVIVAEHPATQTIAATDTITADACGTIKPVDSAGAVTTNTTNTFTAPAAANSGCIMHICNVGAQDITLDNNANFKSAAAGDITLTASDCVTVGSTGAGGAWFQLTAVEAN